MHQEIHTMLEEEKEKIETDEWIDMMEEQIFYFKRRVHTWIKNAEEDRISLQTNKSHSSRGSSVKTKSSSKSNVSKRSSCSNKSDNSKTRAVEEKGKLAELLAEESFLIKQQMAENEPEKLKFKQEIAKAKTRTRVFETSAIEGRGLKIELYSTEAPLITGNCKLVERTWDIEQSRHGEIIWDIPQSRQERNTVGMENEEIDRTVTAGQADVTSMLCNLLKQQSAPDVDLDIFDENTLEYHNI